MLRFEPQTEEEVAGLLPEGNYKFKVITAEFKTSKSGNPMIQVHMKIAGKSKEIMDWLTPAFMKKLKHFCDSTGLLKEYESGELNEDDVLDSVGILNLGIDNENPLFPRNTVVDYIVHDGKTVVEDSKPAVKKKSITTKPKKIEVPEEDWEDDDVPF